MGSATRLAGRLAARSWSAVVFLGAWQLFVVVQDIKPYLLPAPSRSLTNFFTDIELMSSTAVYTGTKALLGLFFGTLLGLAAGARSPSGSSSSTISSTPLAAGARSRADRCPRRPILNNMFNITSRTPRVLVTMIIVFFPVFVNVLRGLVQVQPVQLELMRSMNARPRHGPAPAADPERHPLLLHRH